MECRDRSYPTLEHSNCRGDLFVDREEAVGAYRRSIGMLPVVRGSLIVDSRRRCVSRLEEEIGLEIEPLKSRRPNCRSYSTRITPPKYALKIRSVADVECIAHLITRRWILSAGRCRGNDSDSSLLAPPLIAFGFSSFVRIHAAIYRLDARVD